MILQETPDFWQIAHENIGHFFASHVPAREGEHPDFSDQHGPTFRRSPSNGLILREYDPTACPDFRDPYFIVRVIGEMISMKFDDQTVLLQRVPDAVTEASVYEKRI